MDVRPARRAADRRVAALLAVSLAFGVAALPGWAAGATVAHAPAAPADPPGDPAGEPGDETPPVEPTATDPAPTEAPPTGPPPETATPAPTPTGPAATTPAGPVDPPPTSTAPATTTLPPATSAPPPRPSAPGPGGPAPSRLGVRVSTEDVTLTEAYWNAEDTTTTLRVTVTNTGEVAELIRLSYTLPAGLTDAGTPGCAAAGGGEYHCGGWPTAAGDRFSTLVRVRVDGAAWRRMPLSGAVRVSASAPGVAGPADDNEGFAVLFPPGPPVPGISLDAGGVAFDISGAASELGVRLGNTGKADAAGRIEVVLPAGVTVPTPPAGCAALDQARTRCDVGTVPAGGTVALRLPVSATAEAQRDAPLAGAVIGRVDPRSGQARQLQMSFRITAAAAMSTPIATPAPAGSQGVLAAAGAGPDPAGGLTSVQRTAVILIVVSVLLVVLALALATTALRRRLAGQARPARAPAPSD
ncbi:hypothetical protein OOK41_30290 [Micromonospora sp. NBC_01655]|uniref:hypothetical protein n=1 Tax=Micromonospora sp. NBC_01655 TaxID=2975983 RepID=UPI0022500EE5|nr:hypothetical protein [Micromonospora sp. NBC_01655]MCX4474550.1 hypothetical protein [Micromonospora sp. NBC_01655]